MTVALIIPAFNAAEYIDRALASVAAQTLRPDELLVVDDGSTDGTADVVAAFTRRAPLEVKLLRQANKGVAAARNTGIRACRSEMVVFLDADDTIRPAFLARMAEGFARHPGWSVCFSDRDVVGPDGGFIAKDLDHPGFKALQRRALDHGFFELCDPRLFTAMMSGNLIPMTIALRRTAIEAVGGFDEELRFAEDRLFLLRLIKRGGVLGFAGEVLGIWQRHASNLTAPANAIKGCIYADLALQKLQDDGLALQLSATELDGLRDARRRLATVWLYHASRAHAPATVALGWRMLRERRASLPTVARAMARYTTSALRPLWGSA